MRALQGRLLPELLAFEAERKTPVIAITDEAGEKLVLSGAKPERARAARAPVG